MKGSVRKRASKRAKGKPSYEYSIDLGDKPAQRCTACRKVVWVADARKPGTTCDRCGGALGDVHNERYRKWVGGFATEKAADTAMRTALHQHDTGTDPFPEKMKFREFVAKVWLPHLDARAAVGELKPNTVASYRRQMDAYVLPLIGDVEVSRLRAEHVQRVLDAAANDGKAARTVARVRAVISAAIGHAVLMGRCPANWAKSTKAPKASKPKLVIPTGAELRAIIGAARKTEWETAVLLSATTGLRRGEVLGLRWSAVDLDAARLRVVESLSRVNNELTFTEPKTENSRRSVSLNAEVVARLRVYKRLQAERLLALGHRTTARDLVCDRGDGQPFDPDSYTHAVARFTEKAGCPGVRLHDLRHGVATLWLNLGMRPDLVSRMLGHSSVAFTLSTYVHPKDEDLDALADVLGDALGLA